MRRFLIRSTLLSAICIASPALAGGEVLLTMDPDKGIPTFVDETNSFRKMEFLSVNYQDPASPEAFTMIFEPAFAGQYDTDTTKYTAGTVNGKGEIEFQATLQEPGGRNCSYNPPGSSNQVHRCYVVILKLVNGPRSGSPGFLYRIDMGGGTIDPRVRPR